MLPCSDIPHVPLRKQYDFLRDLFAGVEQRSTIAGGLAYKVTGPPHRLAFDGGLGFEHESRLDEDSGNNAIAAAGVAYAWEFSETGRLADDFATFSASIRSTAGSSINRSR